MITFRLTRLAILVITLALTGCDEAKAPPLALSASARTIATSYKVKTDDPSGLVPCFRILGTEKSQMTVLKKNQLVKIVAIEEGLLRLDDELWLQVYPRLSHRPSCYVNVNNLIPYK